MRCAVGALTLHSTLQKLTVCDDEEHSWKKKVRVSQKAVDDYVKSGMNLAVGTGSTGSIVIDRVSTKLKSQVLSNIRIIPGSEEMKRICISLGIPVCSIDDVTTIHLAIVGADEVDPSLAMLKGRTGSFLREKMLEQAANIVVVAVDDSKLARKLGFGAPLPVEIIPFSHRFTRQQLENLPSLKGSRAIVRVGSVGNNAADGEMIAVTDSGNYIVDIFFAEPLRDLNATIKEIESVAGVVGHGLFMDLATVLLVADNKGVYTIEKERIQNGDAGVPIDSLWINSSMKLPLEREALDNRQPVQQE